MDGQRSAADDRDEAELLQCVGRASDDPRAAQTAQAAFYARHVRYLYGVLLKQKRDNLSAASISAEDLVQETFHRAFERAHTFHGDGITDPDRMRRRARAWLGRIATNLLADHLRSRQEISASPYLEQVSTESTEADEEEVVSPYLAQITEALERLTERERDVLRVSALYYRAGDHQRLPNAASAELAERWEVSNDNIRAIRARAMKKLKSLLGAPGPSEKV